jgi:hypothetical protein
MAVDEKEVERKLAAKEALTPEESRFVMSYPNSEGGNTTGVQEMTDEELGLEDEAENLKNEFYETSKSCHA